MLSPEDGRTVMLIRAYERCRRQAGQSGYQCLKQDGDELTINPRIWNSFKTVLGWMLRKGFQVTWKDAAWEGYIKYVFHALSPTIPQSGQLKNEALVKAYLSSGITGHEEVPPPERSDDTMESIYRLALGCDDYILKLLGIQRV